MKQLTEEQKAIAFNRKMCKTITFTGRSMGKETLLAPSINATHIARIINGEIKIESYGRGRKGKEKGSPTYH